MTSGMSNTDSGARDLDFHLWRLLDNVRFMIFRAREMELSQIGLTPEQAITLDILHANGGSSTINHIVSMTQRQHNSISTLVDRMARQGMVRKTRSRRDRRTFRIALTEKGQGLFAKIPRHSVRSAFSSLDAVEKAALSAYLERVMSRVYDAVGAKYPYPPDDMDSVPPTVP